MLYEGSRDFLKPYLWMVFDPEEKVKTEVKQKGLPRYLPAFEKVSVWKIYIKNALCYTGCPKKLFDVLIAQYLNQSISMISSKRKYVNIASLFFFNFGQFLPRDAYA